MAWCKIVFKNTNIDIVVIYTRSFLRRDHAARRQFLSIPSDGIGTGSTSSTASSSDRLCSSRIRKCLQQVQARSVEDQWRYSDSDRSVVDHIQCYRHIVRESGPQPICDWSRNLVRYYCKSYRNIWHYATDINSIQLHDSFLMVPLERITLHYITSHHITSHRIASHHITSHPVA